MDCATQAHGACWGVCGQHMFENSSVSADISGWNTINVVDMEVSEEEVGCLWCSRCHERRTEGTIGAVGLSFPAVSGHVILRNALMCVPGGEDK